MSESEQSAGMRDQMLILQKFCRRAENTLTTKKQIFKDQLEKLVIIQDPFWQVCNVCLSHVSEPEDFLMKCQVCNVVAHQSCYGPRWNTNDEDFLCFRCAFLINNKKNWNAIRCAFCPEMRGVIRPMFQDFTRPWCHKTCGNYIEGCWWDDRFGFLEQGHSKAFKSKTNIPCFVCESKYGRVIGCDGHNCTFKAHVTCCVKIGVVREYSQMQAQSEREGYTDESYVIVVYCHKHMMRKDQRQLMNSIEFYEKYSKIDGMFFYYDPESPERTVFMNSKAYRKKINDILQALTNPTTTTKKRKHVRNNNKDELESVEDSQQVSLSEQQKFPQLQPLQNEKVMLQEMEKMQDFKWVQYFFDEVMEDVEQPNQFYRQFIEQNYKSPQEYGNILQLGLEIDPGLLHLSPKELFEFLEPVIPLPIIPSPIKQIVDQTQVKETRKDQNQFTDTTPPLKQNQLAVPTTLRKNNEQNLPQNKDQGERRVLQDSSTERVQKSNKQKNTELERMIQEQKTKHSQNTRDGFQIPRAIKRSRVSPEANKTHKKLPHSSHQNILEQSETQEKDSAIQQTQVSTEFQDKLSQDAQVPIDLPLSNETPDQLQQQPQMNIVESVQTINPIDQPERIQKIKHSEPEIRKKIKQNQDFNALRSQDKASLKYYKMVQDSLNQLKFKRIFRKFDDEQDDLEDEEETIVAQHLVMQIPNSAKMIIYKRAKALYDKLL